MNRNNETDVLEYARKHQETAKGIIDDSGLIELWGNVGADVYVIGSLKMELMIQKDIDIHVYT